MGRKKDLYEEMRERGVRKGVAKDVSRARSRRRASRRPRAQRPPTFPRRVIAIESEMGDKTAKRKVAGEPRPCRSADRDADAEGEQQAEQQERQRMAKARFRPASGRDGARARRRAASCAAPTSARSGARRPTRSGRSRASASISPARRSIRTSTSSFAELAHRLLVAEGVVDGEADPLVVAARAEAADRGDDPQVGRRVALVGGRQDVELGEAVESLLGDLVAAGAPRRR